MTTIPPTYLGRLEFFEAHLPVWAKNPAAIGLNASLVAALVVLVEACRADYDSMNEIRARAMAATQIHKDSNEAAYDLGADLVKTIRAFAGTSNNPAVYNTAQIPPPSPHTPLGPPLTPTGVTARLNPVGQIELAWTASRVGGTSFIIERSTVSAAGPWSIIGAAEAVAFTDPAVPVGLPAISYRVTAIRSAGASTPSAAATVPFGTIDAAGGAGNLAA
jgi:hypothetical protein